MNDQNIVHGETLEIPKTNCVEGEHYFTLLYKQPKAIGLDVFIFECFHCKIKEERPGARAYLESEAKQGRAFCLDCTPENEIESEQ
jgi:hypothetical protein